MIDMNKSVIEINELMIEINISIFKLAFSSFFCRKFLCFRQIVQKLCKHSLLSSYNIYNRKQAVLRLTAKFSLK